MTEWGFMSRSWQKEFKESWEEAVALNLFPKDSEQLLTYNLSPWEKAGGSGAGSHPLLHITFEVSLGFMRPCLGPLSAQEKKERMPNVFCKNRIRETAL